MKKLLHERLREAAKNGVSSIETYDENIVVSLLKDEELSLADEIEKYYIPRPRFEDGEPVQRTDKVDWENLRDYHPQSPWMITAIRNDGTPIATAGDKVVAVAKITDDGFVKRHEPKVLDADGVPCKKGETVWRLVDSTKWEISDIHPTEPRIAVRQLDTEKEVVGGWFLAEEYSHREPDSLEKLRDEMLRWTYNPARPGEAVKQWARRLTAIMERDA